jgi:hypothetical protein
VWHTEEPCSSAPQGWEVGTEIDRDDIEYLNRKATESTLVLVVGSWWSNVGLLVVVSDSVVVLKDEGVAF